MAEQSETIGFLRDASLHDGVVPRHVETHISHVFIGPERVFKLKRATQNNFLDFSTPAKRAAACRRELAVNAEAQGLYRGVRAVTRATDGTLALDGAGAAVDWVVEMAPFDSGTEFDRLAKAGTLTTRQVERLADRVATMHARAARDCRSGEADHQIARIEQIAGALAAGAASPGLADAVAAWADAALAARARHAGLIERRARHGFLRRGHGDLHLGNVCLLNGVPTPFDAMEFNEDIATTDVLYDAGFLSMDLLRHGLQGHAAAFTARYLAMTGDYGGVALLPLFMSMRAAVRAIPLAGNDEEGAAALLTRAMAFLAEGERPRLIAIGGASGTGKSTLARDLAGSLPATPFALMLRSDVTRKRLFGQSPEAPLPAEGYAPAASAALYHRLRRAAGHALRAGFVTLVDATFLRVEEQRAMAAVAASAGAGFTGLWLSADGATLKARVAARQGDASDATVGVVAQQLAAAPDAPGWVHLDAGQAPSVCAAAARAALTAGAG